MKTTSRRFGRSTAPGVMDEGMGGGDYPVVFSDLSVDSPIQVIPDAGADDLTVVVDPPRYGDDDNFWGSGDKERKPRPWLHARRTWYIATAIGCILALVAAMVGLNAGGSKQTKHVAYTFPVEAFPQTGVTVSRTWTLYGGAHPTLQGSLIFYSSRTDQVTVEEVLPKSLVTKASQVTFLPKPRILSEDPVVASYTIAPALDGVTSVTYQFPIPGGDISVVALRRWAAEQTTESGLRYLASHQLASVHITPASIVVKKGGAPYQLAVSGLQTDGQPAPTVAFGDAKWSVANPKIAKVSGKGLVTGLTVGKTTVRAVVGKLSATANVVVSAAANVKATPPLKPLLAGGLGNGLPTAITSIGVIPTGAPAVTHTKKPVPTHSKPPVVIHTPPPVITPPSPQCNTASMTAPGGLAATPSSTTAGAVSVSWGNASSTAPCPAVTSYTALVDGAGTFSGLGNATSLSGLAPGNHTLVVYATFANNASLASGALSFVAPLLCSDGVTVTTDPAACPAPPPPPPVCDATTETAPGGLAATPTGVAGEATISWGAAGAVSPCSVSSYTALIDGAASGTGNGGTVTGLLTGTHTLAVTATFADGTSQTSAPISFDVP